MIRIGLRRVAALGIAVLTSCGALNAAAQSYPNRPVTIVMPLSPGGGADSMTRVLAQGLTEELKQSFLVENKPGANGNIGNVSVARAAPDGYTLLSAYSGIQVTNPSLYAKPGWDPIKDFAPVALMGRAPHVVVARKDLPVNNLTELVAYATANPNKLTFASTGIGSLSQIGGEQLMQATKIKMTHVPYRGAGPSMNDLVAGMVDISIVTPASAMGNLSAGNIKALGLMAARRHPMLPDVSTVQEQGLPLIDLTTWFALFAPAGTPDAVIQTLAAKVEKIVASPAYKARIQDQGSYAEFLGPKELGELTARDLAYWRPIIEAAGIRVE
ncbi:tripartite tricarboxylate transporter substrate binding protein [Enterovirga sp.]|uniref:Bug family tripartite tricarboxylate transporter substrate binding protein n=1 Tax=Enterovirga sp. TaxID=2026350 RepID=UPI00260C5F30|nr:tripartite tricarboxylate transporter substrate binding protein [Enterovirga sp.]MDB5592038.1 transporter substrate-binding protein [Enterovirga sp.]